MTTNPSHETEMSTLYREWAQTLFDLSMCLGSLAALCHGGDLDEAAWCDEVQHRAQHAVDLHPQLREAIEGLLSGTPR